MGDVEKVVINGKGPICLEVTGFFLGSKLSKDMI